MFTERSQRSLIYIMETLAEFTQEDDTTVRKQDGQCAPLYISVFHSQHANAARKDRSLLMAARCGGGGGGGGEGAPKRK